MTYFGLFNLFGANEAHQYVVLPYRDATQQLPYTVGAEFARYLHLLLEGEARIVPLIVESVRFDKQPLRLNGVNHVRFERSVKLKAQMRLKCL